MRGGVGGVFKLAGDDAAGIFAVYLLRPGHRGGHTAGTGGQHHFGAVSGDELDALRAHGVRHDDDGPVSQHGGQRGDAYARVAAGGLYDEAAGDERAVRRRGAYHAQRGAVLGAAGGVEALQLGQDVKPRGKAAQAHERGGTDKAGNIVVNCHNKIPPQEKSIEILLCKDYNTKIRHM